MPSVVHAAQACRWQCVPIIECWWFASWSYIRRCYLARLVEMVVVLHLQCEQTVCYCMLGDVGVAQRVGMCPACLAALGAGPGWWVWDDLCQHGSVATFKVHRLC